MPRSLCLADCSSRVEEASPGFVVIESPSKVTLESSEISQVLSYMSSKLIEYIHQIRAMGYQMEHLKKQLEEKNGRSN